MQTSALAPDLTSPRAIWGHIDSRQIMQPTFLSGVALGSVIDLFPLEAHCVSNKGKVLFFL
jgi:hypothetical protein